MALPADFIAELKKNFAGEMRVDVGTRALYSTDASIYQIEPLGVALPRSQEDLHAAAELAARHRIPILPRGAGTSLAGQAIGEALILDCSRWLDRIVAIDPEARTAIVEPGVLLGELNRVLEPYDLQFGPDPASAERATLGGVIANNATGAHSIAYGMAADHLLQSDVIFSDGSLGMLGPVGAEAIRRAGDPAGDRMRAILSCVQEIRGKHADRIKLDWPEVWRNSAGYRLNYMLPWSPSAPPQWPASDYPPRQPETVNLAALLAGSEGTLAVIRTATLNLVPKPKHTILGVLAYPSVAAACVSVPGLLALQPSAIELVPEILIRLARTVPAYAAQMGWVVGEPAALLIVEFSGEDPRALGERVRRLPDVLAVAETEEEQRRVWNVRRVGLGLLDSRPQSGRPTAFMEDCAVPVDRLGKFVREVERILADHRTQAGFYAHASAGCLHIRPILDLKTIQGAEDLRAIAQSIVAVARALGGEMSSEHGDGLSRSEWLRQTYGGEIFSLMAALKRAADPENLLNPGKIVAAPRMDSHLRYAPNLQVRAWDTPLSFESQGGLVTAIEQCNGQGVCRKTLGVMCPSYQATREEMHSTRGRANLLRALINRPAVGGTDAPEPMQESVAQALDLCLACKGCKAECPSGVDMARLKYAFEAEYYKTRRRPLRDYLFGYFHQLAAVLQPVAGVTNAIQSSPSFRRIIAGALGISPQRHLPRISRRRANPARRTGRQAVLYLPDLFTHFFEPHAEQAAFDLLEAAQCDVHMLPIVGAGAALLSKGLLPQARGHVQRLLASANAIDPDATMPIVGLEPAEVYALKHDLLDLLPADSAVAETSARVWLVEEFLVRSGNLSAMRVATNSAAFFHPHCHQRGETPAPDGMPSGTSASQALMQSYGYRVEVSQPGCCGMAGTFGYEAEHYALSQRIGELSLFPLVRARGADRIAATGGSCRIHIAQATGTLVEHPIVLAARAFQEG